LCNMKRMKRAGDISADVRRNLACPAAFLLAAILFCGVSCGRKKEDEPPAKPRVEETSKDRITVTMVFDPPRVRIDRDLLMTLRIAAPSEMDVEMPSLSDRLTGFQIAGVMDSGRRSSEGTSVQERRVLLTPLVSGEYRIAPLPIVYTDRSRTPPMSGWFPTRPVLLDPVAPAGGKSPGDIEETLSPFRIPPSGRTIALWLLALAAAAAAAWIIHRAIVKIRRAIRLRRMSPKSRALFELDELLAENLVEKGRVKDFYLRLTMIVRRYIERAHGIRAPEQTTEEFLAAAGGNPRFKPAVLERLKAFLEAADLVKFAAHKPTPQTVANSVATAREYIESDAADNPQGGA